MGSPRFVLRRYLIKVWYLGTGFSGSQRQPNKRTVEGELLHILKKKGYYQSEMTFDFKAATRTDAGVHAYEAIFAFSTEKPLYPNLIDQNLPSDMGFYAWAEVPLTFNPRFETAGKEYHYILPIEPEKTLNFSLIQSALEIMKGTHDFRLLAKKDRSKHENPTTPTITRSELYIQATYLKFIFEGKYFLWEQIRRMVTFLFDIGNGTRTLDDLSACFLPENYLSKHPEKIKPSPADGLTLIKFYFSEPIEFNYEENAVERMKKCLEKRFVAQSQQAGAALSILQKARDHA